MPEFKYKAMNNKGERLEGIYVAESKEAVMDMISANSYYPLNVEEINTKNNIDFSKYQKIKIKDIAIFCRQFYTMLDAGVSISSALRILSEELPNKKLKDALAKVEEGVKKGETLSSSMRAQENIFPELLINMVETGELSGNLDTIMLRMSDHFEKENRINAKIKNAMVYPAVLGVVAISVVIFILTFVMPIFVEMFNSSGTVLPTPTKIVLAISNFITTKWYLLILIIGIIVFSIRYYKKTEKGKRNFAAMRLKIPIVKALTRKTISSRFTRTLSTLLASGINLVQALEIVSSVVGNVVAEDKIMEAREGVIKGDGLSGPLRETKLFPTMLSSMIKIGEESGSLEEILNKTADFYDEELEEEIKTFTSLIEPMMIAVMGLVVGFIVISILLPMFGMYDTIQ